MAEWDCGLVRHALRCLSTISDAKEVVVENRSPVHDVVHARD
jgi:hypothetical protein